MTDTLKEKIDNHETRIQTLESHRHSTDRDMAVITTKLDQVLEMIKGITTAIRNSSIALVIGAIVWVLVQMAGG